LDHTLGNVSLLGMGLKHDRRIYLIDGQNKVQMIKAPTEITIEKASQHGKYISVFPYMQKASGVTMEGFKYPLTNVTLEGFSTLTVSNEIVDEYATIKIEDGYLIVCEATD
ncbi:MAG: thiamine diphosphokinase, partial [Pseudobutyrivibrio sp.]|nr:thiamine diphosphokinase [Pseudobutyrivibrio sp.]